jgi:hypothetical protein
MILISKPVSSSRLLEKAFAFCRFQSTSLAVSVDPILRDSAGSPPPLPDRSNVNRQEHNNEKPAHYQRVMIRSGTVWRG